jgi:DnaJ-domain-containing protein 1
MTIVKMYDQILQLIVDHPGASIERLCRVFHLTEYRLKRVLGHIEANLSGKTIVYGPDHGVWIVELDSERCLGINWQGNEGGGYVQCEREPEFPDGRCWRHSGWENLELIAFERRLGYLTGPCEANPYALSQLSIEQLEELIKTLSLIAPATFMQQERKKRFMATLAPALAILRWKDQMRRRRMGQRIPPEFAQRHSRSSVNIFEFSLKSHFEALELPPDCTKEQVLKAWRKLARRYHPDTLDGDEERMKAINLAKEKIFRIRGWD